MKIPVIVMLVIIIIMVLVLIVIDTLSSGWSGQTDKSKEEHANEKNEGHLHDRAGQ